ncbi:cobalamin biosynthesis protein [Methanocella sp. CWC-04]|uniref:Probable cobalamin biosynthesis protein CobD n=1 Tax=Methanooceanicella nereidis TaxID=2052831 RepID=A0AAP2RDN1_9EURY|nr:cobalamin biosynthesis protein [Methanocella sp. CWC-04]
MLEAFALAVALDLIFGEPKEKYHPVVWIGRFIGYLKEHPPKRFKVLYGFLLAFLTIGLTVGIGYGISVILYGFSPLIALLATAYLLKSTFCLSFLWAISGDIYSDLKAGRLDLARSKLPALVGRDVSKLNPGQMSSCVVESLGESFVDGILSPLFYFAIFGLPGALAYRAINTLDSMVGYKDEKHRQIGFASAKIDDVANFIPARLSVILMALVAILFGGPIRSLKTALKDARNTPSINSGYPMSAFAGALGVRLEKIGYYVLGEGLRPCDVNDIGRAILYNKALTAALVSIIIIILYFTGFPLIQV